MIKGKKISRDQAISFIGEDVIVPGEFWGLFDDAVLVGVSGLLTFGEFKYCFAEITEEARRYPIAMVKLAKTIIKNYTGKVVTSCAEGDIRAEKFIERMADFKYIRTEQGERVYEYSQQRD